MLKSARRRTIFLEILEDGTGGPFKPSFGLSGAVLSILHQVGVNTIDGATYTYDNVGNRLTKLNQLNSVTETYGYDNI